MTNPLSCVKNTRRSYRKDLQKTIVEVQVQFNGETPAWIPYETLLAISTR
jgi:hypothetical protein